MRKMSELISEYRQGGSFTDDECIAVRNHCKDVADKLVLMGDTFHIAFKEANSIFIAFDGYCVSRGLDVNSKSTFVH